MGIKQFILGASGFPEWFDRECGSGRIKVIFDDDGRMTGAKVYSPSGTMEAEMGDTVMLLRSGPQVIKKDKTRKASHAEKDKQEAE